MALKMSSSIYPTMASLELRRVSFLSHPGTGAQGMLVVDDRTLGPPVIALRVGLHGDERHALQEAGRLARAMTLRASLAGLDHGGAALLVQDRPTMDRARAFEWLGGELSDLARSWVIGDRGATRLDMRALEQGGARVDMEPDLRRESMARGVVRGLQHLAQRRERRLEECCVAVQGAGPEGEAVAALLSAMGCELVIADPDARRAREVADRLGAQMVPAHGIWSASKELLAPCAAGGLIGPKTAPQIEAFGICGTATHQVVDLETAQALQDRGILHVPGVLSTAGSLPAHPSERAPALSDETLLSTIEDILDEAEATGRPPSQLVDERAWERIELSG
ncbi:MAG: hypothetical protein VX899_24105 [Myxococcota bacterium]|nr:hypothetical protein [Myxococcota bacterium]